MIAKRLIHKNTTINGSVLLNLKRKGIYNMNNFEMYGTKFPIWWTKLTEDKPSKKYFETINFEWEKFNQVMGWNNQFQGYMVLPDDSYTYFKIIDKRTNTTSYWFVDNKTMQLSQGCNYLLGLDVWTTYNMNILENLPNDFLLGVERTHLSYGDYQKYNTIGALDEMLNIGNCGDTYIKTKPLIRGRFSSSNQTDKIWMNYYDGTKIWDIEFTGKTSLQHQHYLDKCYVFSALNNYPISRRASQYIIFPVIDVVHEFKSDSSEPFHANKKLGNTYGQLDNLVQKKQNQFLGIFNLPVLTTTDYLVFDDFFADGDMHYYGINVGLWGIEQHPFISISKDLLKVTTKLKYNSLDDKLNIYGFVNSNNNFYAKPITPLYTFFNNGNNIDINVGKKLVFNAGFMSLLNNRDMLIYGGQLPSNKETFDAYMNSMREQMNAGIKASRDKAILGGVQSSVNIGVGVGQAIGGGLIGDSAGAMKGAMQAVGGVFSLASSIVNHENTKNRYAAQIADAKNSIPVGFNISAEDDLRMNLLIDNPVNNGGDINGAIILRKFNQTGITLNNNIAFLYGVKVSNYIPFSVIKNNLAKVPCLYLELQNSFVKSVLLQYVATLYPKMNNTLKQVIADAWNVGYRIWNEPCNLSLSYEIEL